jgi:hypothetical protein
VVAYFHQLIAALRKPCPFREPLDIGCLAVLKRAYARLIELKTRARITHIDKLDFLEAYPSARIEAFKSETIKTSFATAGLMPYNPD